MPAEHGRRRRGTSRLTPASARPSPTRSSSPSGPAFTSTRRRRRRTPGRLLERRLSQHDGILPRRRAALRADPRRRTASASSTGSGRSSISSPALPCGSTRASSGSSAPSRGSCAAPEFDFVRAEDKDADLRGQDQAAGRGLPGQGPQESARARPRSQAINDHFEIISASIRRVEQARLAAEPSHVEALQAFAERAYRRPLSPAERDGVAAFYRTLRDAGRAEPRGRRARHGRQRADVAPLLLPRRPARRAGTGVRPLSDYALASRLSYFLWSSMPDEELLAHAAAGDLHRPEVLMAQARRMLQRRPRPRPGHRVRRQLARLPPLRGAQQRRSRRGSRRFNDELRRAMFEEPIRFFIDVVQNDRSVLEFARRQAHVRQPGPGPALRHARAARSGPTAGCGSTTRAVTGAAGCCRWRCS